ncbi:MAG: preprotein translocase subunit TatB, partial [Firmicutes bacterium]|nr:preprotein translocase subunit TatB [Bacillota bacterium]
MERLDVRGLSCPEPVLRVRQALKNKDELLVLLDSQIALENVKRMAQNMGL